jgi:hypothetical protein
MGQIFARAVFRATLVLLTVLAANYERLSPGNSFPDLDHPPKQKLVSIYGSSRKSVWSVLKGWFQSLNALSLSKLMSEIGQTFENCIVSLLCLHQK